MEYYLQILFFSLENITMCLNERGDITLHECIIRIKKFSIDKIVDENIITVKNNHTKRTNIF